MVRRHNKRHSLKRGGSKSGKRSRSRRQSGGMWRSLINANTNVVYERGNPTHQKGIDIKYTGSNSKREWLIGGDDKTVRQLLDGAKEGRYIDVIRAIRSMRGGAEKTLPDNQKGITLDDSEFRELFVRNLSTDAKPLADKYRGIYTELSRQPDVFHSMLFHTELPPVGSSMFNPVPRHAHAYHASHASAPSHLDETRVSDHIAQLGRR